SESYVLEGFPEPGDFSLPFSIPLAVGESEGLGRLAETGERYDVELTTTVECAQPYTKTRRVLGLFNWSTESGWYWIPTATLTQVVPFTPQKPMLVPVLEEIFKKIAPPAPEPALPPPPPVWEPATRLPTGDIASPAETVMVYISNVRVEAPPLPDWLSRQGIQDIVRGYIGQLNIDGQIQEVAIGLRSEIGQATARGEELAEQVRAGIRQIDLLRGEVYSVRRDFAATLARTQERLDTLFATIEPLKRQVGQFLTRQEIEELVATKVTQMLADRVPPVPKASITQVTGAMVVARAGDLSTLAVTVLVNEQASYRMGNVFDEQVLGPGSHVFPAEVRTAGERTTAQFELQGRAPDGTWGMMSRREVVVSAAALREPSTTAAPSIELAEVNLVELPAGGVSVYAGLIKVRTKHELANPGAGFRFNLFYWVNGGPIMQYDTWAIVGTGEYPIHLFVPSVGFPARRPTVRITVETYISDTAGNQWYDRKQVYQEVQASVLYPDLKVSGALKPPVEAAPGAAFPLIVAYENATGIPGAGRIGGYEFPIVGRAGTVSLFGAFPNEDLASVTTQV
ncbi:MAG: hypothetical protein Q8O40_14025, partial [Chloroflexota bacterium]|nr:hypothetical protein [Chloroflexota bacterium]